MFFYASIMMAGSGIFQTFSFYSINGGGLITNHGGIDNSSGTNAWSGNNLGSDFTTLILNGGEVQTFKNGGSNVTGTALFYRVYKQGAVTPAYSSISLPFFENFENLGDQKWNTGTANINLLSGISENGTYNIDLYWEAYSTDGTHSDGIAASPFTATFSMTLLPVELINFSVKKIQNKNRLTWQTATETNNSHFDLQRSTNSKTWSNIGYIQGKGTTNQIQSYYFEDTKPHSGYNYYRLKQVDFDGAFNYSPIVLLNNKNTKIEVFPNPTSQYFELKITDYDESDQYTILLTNTQGSILEQINPRSINTRITLNNMPASLYLISVFNEEGSLVFVRQLNKL